MPSRTTLRLWLPPLLWTAVILTASSASFSSANTGPVLAKLINAIFPVSPDTFAALHFLIRKAGHLAGYGILGALVLRAIRAERPGWKVSWAIAAIAFAAVVASLDEWNQSFIPSRTAAPQDVLIDTLGATLAQVLFFRA